MSEHFKRSLLKGMVVYPMDDVPLDSLQNSWDKLPPLERFLIQDSLNTLAYTPPSTAVTLTSPAPEQYPFAHKSIATKFLNLPEKVKRYLVEYIILQHIENKVLFHPILLPYVLNHRDMWIAYITLLPKVLRRTAHWLSTKKSSWNWWAEITNLQVWQQDKYSMKYWMMLLYHSYKPTESLEIIKESFIQNNIQDKEIGMEIITLHLSDLDVPFLEWVMFNGQKKDLKWASRCLAFLNENDFSRMIRAKVDPYEGNIYLIENIQWGADEQWGYYFKNHQKGIPMEVFLTYPYSYFKVEGDKKLVEYWQELPEKKQLIKSAFRYYIRQHDWASLTQCFDDLLNLGMEYVLDVKVLDEIRRLPLEKYDEMWSYMKQHATTSTPYYLSGAVYSIGIMPLSYDSARYILNLFLINKNEYNNYRCLQDSMMIFIHIALSLVSLSQLDDFKNWVLHLILIHNKNKNAKEMKMLFENVITFKTTIK